MKLGRVVIDLGYVVDQENPEMVENAYRCFMEDIMNNVYNPAELAAFMEIEDDPEADESDIPEFIRTDWDPSDE